MIVSQLAGHKKAVGNMLVLFLGKSAGLFVGLLFLPMYHRYLGPEQFGIVAVVLSLQALLTMMDLGMSTIVGREASTSSMKGTYRLVLSAEMGLTGFYVCLAIASLAAQQVGLLGGIDAKGVFASVILFCALVLQNLYFSVLLAKRSYMIASSTQIVGSLIRACVSAYILAFVSATLDAFLCTQAVFAIAHAVLTRYFCKKALVHPGISEHKKPAVREVASLVRHGFDLVVFSAAGAAVTQLDKPIVSTLASTSDVAPYFLAMTVCMVPISLLASPISQFFQPRVLAEVIDNKHAEAAETTRQFVCIILAATIAPAVVLWIWRLPLIELWLRHDPVAGTVASYVAILLPGYVIGSLGFVPYALLVAAKEYRFQALSSVALTVLTLCVAALAASKGDIKAVCWTYAIYHSSSTTVSWIRASMSSRVGSTAKASLKIAAKVLVVIAIGGYIVNQLT
jgi:O-antigen/teichoic acid export membrane protein